jgi:hypothetical protein
MEIRIIDENYMSGVFKLVPFERVGEGRVAIASNIIMEELEPGLTIPFNAGIKMEKGELQELINELWRLGFRPSILGPMGSVEAKDAHLADLRANGDKMYELLYKFANKAIK